MFCLPVGSLCPIIQKSNQISNSNPKKTKNRYVKPKNKNVRFWIQNEPKIVPIQILRDSPDILPISLLEYTQVTILQKTKVAYRSPTSYLDCFPLHSSLPPKSSRERAGSD